MLNPVALSIIASAFREPKDRARAVGVWGAVGGLSFAAGPLLGGALTQAIGWRSIFWINVPIGLAAVALAARFIRESKAARTRRRDPLVELRFFRSAPFSRAILPALCSFAACRPGAWVGRQHPVGESQHGSGGASLQSPVTKARMLIVSWI